MHPCGHMLLCMLVYESISHVSVHVWCVLEHGVITLCRARVFSAGFPSQHCSFVTLHFLPPGWLTEVHKLQWTLLCLLLSWGSFGPNQNLQHHRVNWKTSKASSESSFYLQKKKITLSFFEEEKSSLAINKDTVKRLGVYLHLWILNT